MDELKIRTETGLIIISLACIHCSQKQYLKLLADDKRISATLHEYGHLEASKFGELKLKGSGDEQSYCTTG